MTRKKYDYQRLIFMPQFIELQKISPKRAACQTEDEELAAYEAELRAFREKDRVKAGKWVSWTHGAALTHNPDGSKSQELQDWLKVNEKLIEIGGYAEIGEAINIWNPQEQSWAFDKQGEFKFSAVYWEYLLSEGYVERWIECQESRLSSKFQSLSYSFPTEYIQQRIMETEIPHLDRRDHLGYDPLKGLMSEREIYRFQDAAQVNPLRNKRLMVAESAK
jgi:hypothetical protein